AGVVLRQDDLVAGDAARDADGDRAIYTGHERGVDGIAPAVEVALELDDLVAAGVGARQAHGHLHRLRAGAGEAQPLCARDKLLHPATPLDLGRMRSAEVRPP